MEKENYYIIEVKCDNCDYGHEAIATQQIEKGCEVPVKMVCPKCENKELKKC